MKKLIIFGILILLIISIALAVQLNSKEEAISYLNTVKSARNIDITNSHPTWKYLTDKICYIDWDTEVRKCGVEIEITYTKDGNTKKVKQQVTLIPDTTKAVDEETIQYYVDEYIDNQFPKEEITYVEKKLLKKTKII